MKLPNKRKVLIIIGRIALATVTLGLWEIGARTGRLDHFFFSQPSDILSRVGSLLWSGRIWHNLATTAVEALLSFLVGTIFGMLAGFVLARRLWLADLFDPYLRVANAVPRVLLAPIFLLWFGLGIWSKVALGVTVVFFVVFFNAYNGVREVPRALLNNARMLGASEWHLVRHVLAPSAMSWIFSSLHISIGFSIIAVVVGEYLGSSEGIGYMIAQAEGVLDTTGVFAGITILSVFVLVVGAGVAYLERNLVKWKPTAAISSAELQ